MVPSLFTRDLLSEMDRIHREWRRSFDAMSPDIRGFAQGYPALNVGTTPTSVEIYAFAPGVDPQHIQLDLDRRVLTIAGERTAVEPGHGATERRPDNVTHVAERFIGRFKRIVSLPEDIDPDAVTADYEDGVLTSASSAASPRSRAASRSSKHLTKVVMQENNHDERTDEQ